MVASSPEVAVKNGRAVDRYDSGMCQKFVRDQCWRVPSLYGSAIEAWNGAKFKHPGDRTPPKGAPTYYRGGNYGHAVIWVGNEIRSTDCTTAYDVSEVAISWVENNWGYTYLGWTEDINGVRVITPGGGEEEDMGYSDWSDKDKKALANDVVDTLLSRDLYDNDASKDVSVGRALRVAENAGNKTLDEK